MLLLGNCFRARRTVDGQKSDRRRGVKGSGYTYFLMKGLVKVRCEWSLITLAYNLKRVLKLVSLPKLMQAVGAKAPQTA